MGRRFPAFDRLQQVKLCHHIATVCLFCILTAAHDRALYAKRSAGYDNQIVLGYTLNRFLNITSEVGCLEKCSMDLRCQTIFFNPQMKLCDVNSIAFLSDAAWMDSEGTRYYTASHEKCPSEKGYSYRRAENLCYRVSLDVEFRWPEARQACREEGADLAVVNTAARFDFFFRLMGTSPVLSVFNGGMLVGLSDADSDGVYEWVDGTPLPSTSPLWGANEPSFNGIYVRMANAKNRRFDDMNARDNFACEIII